SVLGRIVRRSNNNTVGDVLFSRAVVDKNGARDDRRGSDAVVWLNYCLHFVGGQYLKRRTLRWTRKRMSVFSHVQRTVCALTSPVIADGLSDGENMRFIE